MDSFRPDAMEIMYMFKSFVLAMQMSGGVLSFIVTGCYDF